MTELSTQLPVMRGGTRPASSDMPPIDLREVSLDQQHRELVLKDLLGPDYEYAQDAGLIDMFYYDPSESKDGLLHTLTGEIVPNSETRLPSAEGFHHEPSARDSQTFVDRKHLEPRSGKDRRKFAQYPYEPFRARVVVNDIRKASVITDPQTREQKLTERNNNMFPNEYDALAVLQAVKYAYDHYNPEDASIVESNLIVEADTPMLDGQTMMPVRMVIDSETGKITSAYPITRGLNSVMKLDEAAIASHLFSSTVRSESVPEGKTVRL